MKDQLAETARRAGGGAAEPDIKHGPGVGTGVGVGVGAGNDAGLPDRAMITSNATRRQRRHQHRRLQPQHRRRRPRRPRHHAGRRRGRRRWRRWRRAAVAARATASAPVAVRGGTLNRSGSGKASRSIEEIKLVFERNKGAIYAIYNRALREEPSLQGKVVLELKIAPSGEVVDVQDRVERTESRGTRAQAAGAHPPVRLRRQGRGADGRDLAGGLPAVLTRPEPDASRLKRGAIIGFDPRSLTPRGCIRVQPGASALGHWYSSSELLQVGLHSPWKKKASPPVSCTPAGASASSTAASTSRSIPRSSTAMTRSKT